MGLRWPFLLLLVETVLFQGLYSANVRRRRETSASLENKQILADDKSKSSPSESYHPPLLAAPPAPQVTGSGPYQPPLLLPQSNDYKPLISSSQTQSVRYQPPNSPAPVQGVPLAYAYPQPAPPPPPPPGYSAPLLANNQQGNPNALHLPQDSRQGHGLVYAGDHSGLNQFSQSPPAQTQGAETQPGAVAVPSSNDGKNDEYVVYYYYYYDNDTSSNGSSNFDDIPTLESYDTDKTKTETEKSGSTRIIAADVNSLAVGDQTANRIQDTGLSSQPRSVSSGNPIQSSFVRPEKPQVHHDEAAVQPLKPVSNVFRYGSNEVPRFPVLPSFVVSEAPPVTRPGIGVTPDQLSPDSPSTESTHDAVGSPHANLSPVNVPEENDEDNKVVDRFSETKVEEDRGFVEEQTTTTSTEPPTTTEPTTTTTERTRRRPGAGGRRRFNPSPSFSSNRRQPPTRSTTSTTTTTTTSSPAAAAAAPTRGSFRGSSRARPRPSIGSSRARPSFSRNTPSTASVDNAESSTKAAETSSSTTSTTTTRPRFGSSSSSSSSSSRRFSSTRTRSQPSRTTRSTTTTTTTTASPRSRPSLRPRPNLISRNRPRPGFLRPRPGVSEPEEPETTTATPEPPTQDESSPSSVNESSVPEEEETSEEDESEEEDTADTETEAPTTTTEKNRFSALFRPRNRNPLNRPRPPLPGRSRRSR